MKQLTIFAATALLALTACDKIPFLQGGKAEANGSAAAPGNAVADAGITQSRSLAGLNGGGESGAQSGGAQSGGSKDPAAGTAIEAGSTQGVVDPRLVGRWTDNGDCKDAAELRPDGTFLASNGASGRWSVAGNQLVFTGAGGEYRLRIDSVEPDRIVTTTAQGQSGGSTRC